MIQPFLMECMLQAAEIDARMTNSCLTPVVGPLLPKDANGLPCKDMWKYHTLTGMLGNLQGTSCPKISMAVHQCAQFNNDPKLCHKHAMKQICKYLLKTSDKGLIYVLDMSCSIEGHQMTLCILNQSYQELAL